MGRHEIDEDGLFNARNSAVIGVKEWYVMEELQWMAIAEWFLTRVTHTFSACKPLLK